LQPDTDLVVPHTTPTGRLTTTQGTEDPARPEMQLPGPAQPPPLTPDQLPLDLVTVSRHDEPVDPGLVAGTHLSDTLDRLGPGGQADAQVVVTDLPTLLRRLQPVTLLARPQDIVEPHTDRVATQERLANQSPDLVLLRRQLSTHRRQHPITGRCPLDPVVQLPQREFLRPAQLPTRRLLLTRRLRTRQRVLGHVQRHQLPPRFTVSAGENKIPPTGAA